MATDGDAARPLKRDFEESFGPVDPFRVHRGGGEKRERERRREKLVLLEEKRRRDEERRRKEVEKEVERRRKEEEKAVKEEKKRLKDEEKRKKDEEKQRIEDEKKKKAASQKTLSSFFGTPASAKASKDDVSTSPASAGLAMPAPSTTSANLTLCKKEVSPYEKMFPAFFVQNGVRSQIKRTRAQLKDIPMKYLKFQEDVRPPYQGTYTHTPMHGISKLARNPMRRDLPNTNYDYDSEAEWIEDEDAEDLNSEGEEDEEGLDDVEDMDGFLDDENDDLLNSRRAMGGIQGDLEPVSTGLCWEDTKKRNRNVTMMPYRMEFIIDPNVNVLILSHGVLGTHRSTRSNRNHVSPTFLSTP
ncbi:hypothetical protein DID88_004674 [Monilinia fructigena]|uniref:Chromatin assembly factor 1 subunit A n=1 Tax=Monilinia fructigena TaxID=38457 RepID=A0A395IRB7_9HELO|nr:hypothetical protein DID88_004674 [Monilinia fructigena]